MIYEDNFLCRYEREGHWEKCVHHLFSIDGRNDNIMARLLIECWYVLANWDCFICHEKIIKRCLKEV